MKNKIKDKKLNQIFFILISIACLFLLGVLLAVISVRSNIIKIKENKENSNYDRYYINTDYKDGDFYITKKPNLKDILAGPIITSLDPSLGEISAPVVLVQFSDFECQYCSEQEKVLKELLNIYGDKVKLIWKDYPESSIETPSYQAAIAARCAQEQDKFWEYHDALYKSKKLNQDEFINIAEKLKLKKGDFKNCLNSDRPKNLVNDNILEADALEIYGIPFVYINDQEAMGQMELEDFQNIIDKELEK